MRIFQIERSKDDYNVLKVIDGKKIKYIGSKYNQKREIERIYKDLKPFNAKDIIIIFGLGSGEHIKYILENNPFKNKILIIDIFDGWIEESKGYVEIKKVIEEENVTIASNEKEIKKFFEKEINDFNIDWIKISYFGKYDILFKNEIKDILKVIRDEITGILNNKDTNIFFSEVWFKSLIGNLPYMLKATPSNRYKNKYKNKAAVIVSAGPSLDKNISELKNKENLLILTGGRTLGALMNNNIEPSLLGVIDPGKYSYEVVKDYIRQTKCPLLFYEGTNEKVVREHKGNKIIYSENELLNNIFKENLKIGENGGSVAHTLTNFAIKLGCNPIIFIGQDLAYTGEKYHSENSSITKFNNVRNKEKCFLVDSVDGEKIKTNAVLNGFRKTLEKIIEETSPNIRFINATEGGANIKGTEIMNLKDTLKLLRKEKVTFNYMEEVGEETKKNTVKNLEEIIQSIKYLRKNSKMGLKLLDKLLSYKKIKDKRINLVIKNLDLIDENIRKNILDLDVLKNLIYKKIYIIENHKDYIIIDSDSKEEEFNKNLNKNKVIYELLIEVADLSQDSIEKILENIEKI